MSPADVCFDPGPDYRGRLYDRFYVRRDVSIYPGWFIFGRNPEYGDRLIKLCGRPHEPKRRYRKRTCLVYVGWRYKREAAAALQLIREGKVPAHVSGLCG